MKKNQHFPFQPTVSPNSRSERRPKRDVKKRDAAYIEIKIYEYYNTVPTTVRFHQQMLMSRKVITRPPTSTSSTSKKYKEYIDITFIPKNVKSQFNSANEINSAMKKISKFEQMMEISTDDSMKVILSSKIIEEQKIGIVEKYDTPGRPSIAMKNPDLWDKIHNSIEFGAAHAKCRKAAKVFAEVFADESIIISQDDKVKIGLGIPAISCTFKIIQTVNKPVIVEDHDFLTGLKMKLIPSVYLLINPADSSDTLRTVKLIWILLVNGGPDENPKHMKNIIQYAHLFRSLNLDYLTIRTHALGQSAYCKS
ncbi:hypothetical protein C1646_773756 [Rhizophagus diaphanus]|nr:hypothetical protein C1646_773756 [Rhizophagus diaphanus] [Rhizophagus sp. MUCL 43196]